MFYRTRALEEATAELSERERALQALSDELAERNRQLAEQAVMLQQHLAKEQEAVAELRKLNRMKSEFVAMASHELRTPLTTIIGFAKTLRRHEFAENPSLRKEFLDAMERQGERLLRLVENLLTAAHLEDDRLSVTADRVLLADLLRGVLEGLGPVASRVRIDLSAGPLELQTDRQLLSRVVANLLDNAIKYSGDDAVCDLSTRLEGEEVVITVRDHGIGIPADEIDRIFEPFYQVDSSDTRTFAGVGLGLSLVQRVLGALGGSIEVVSRVGRGSTFVVRVPVRFRERTVGSSNASHPGGGQEESPGARRLRRPA
jgi:signal transduction histidine kinase